MSTFSAQTDPSDLRQALGRNPENPELLHAYYQSAVAAGKAEEARGQLAELQQRFQWNHQIRELSIALSLVLGDHPAAMADIEKLLAFSEPTDALIDSALAVRERLGPMSIEGSPGGIPTISLCMIIKNEQAFLGPCLNAIKPLADEIIVVDTGSADRSADIARIYGARVFEMTWREDFSLARNRSLDKAEGEWILILDADEIIAERDHAALRRLIETGRDRASAYRMVTRNYSNLANTMDWQANDGAYPEQETGIGWFPTGKVRLFPRSTDIRFKYPVHELVEPSIQKAGMRIEPCPVPIHHYGHVNEAKNAQKALHYFELGYAKLAQLGDDKAALRELAVQAGQLQRWREAIELWHRFLELSPDFAEAYVNLGGAYWQLGEYDTGMKCSQRAIDIDPELKEGRYNLAVNLMMGGNPEAAADILRALGQRQKNYLAAEFMLAVAVSLSGDARQGRSLFEALEKKVSDEQLVLAGEDLLNKIGASPLAAKASALSKAAPHLFAPRNPVRAC